jgi:acetolactate synthase-1/2/3 large subunit
MARTLATVIAESLAAAGITHAFAVPGESYLPLLDAMRDVPVRLVTCRHEAAAANMAEAAAKLSGKPGVVMVTRGPGASHALIGLHTAQQDSTPLLLLVGQVGSDSLGREAFQEVDYSRLFGGIAKAVITLDEPERAGEQMAHALSLAASGRPGPVVVVLPEDRLALPSAAPALAPAAIHRPAPSAAAIAAIAARLADAQRPLLLLGGPGWCKADVAAATALAERQQLPVVTSWRRKDRFDNLHPHYAGELGLGANPALVAAVRQADLLLVIGARLGENPTQGWTLISAADAAGRLVHIHQDPGAIGKVWQPALGVEAGIGEALQALASLPPHPGDRGDWVRSVAALHAAWRLPTTVEAGVNPAAVIAHLAEALPVDTIYANGAGNFAAWLHRFMPHRRLGTQLAPTSGAMGYGVPAGIAASILHPGRQVVVVAGDGDFLMAAGELATVAHEGATPLVLVFDNGQYGTIRMHQARDFPGRVSGTPLTNPDFAALARSFGLHAETVNETAAFPAALARCRGRAALLHLLQDPAEISPGRRLEPGA